MVGPRQDSCNQSLAYLSSPREASWVDFQAPKQAHALPRTPTRHCPPVSPATSLLWLKNQARKPSHEPPKWHHTLTRDSGGRACCGPTTISLLDHGSGVCQCHTHGRNPDNPRPQRHPTSPGDRRPRASSHPQPVRSSSPRQRAFAGQFRSRTRRSPPPSPQARTVY